MKLVTFYQCGIIHNKGGYVDIEGGDNRPKTRYTSDDEYHLKTQFLHKIQMTNFTINLQHASSQYLLFLRHLASRVHSYPWAPSARYPPRTGYSSPCG